MTAAKNYLTVDRVRLAYEEYGQGEAILFLHGFGESSFSWRRAAQTISEKLNCRSICLDLMGFGGSEKPRGESYTLARQTNLVSVFIDEMGLNSLSLAGHSYGGGICLLLVSQISTHSHFSVNSMILADTICYPQKFPGFISYLRRPVLRWFAANLIPDRVLARSVLGSCYASREKVTDEAVAEIYSALQTDGAWEALIATAENIIPGTMDALIHSYEYITIPTLILWGAEDGIVPLELGQRLNSVIPSSTLKILERCGHIPQEEFPQETAKLIMNFLSRDIYNFPTLNQKSIL